MTTIHVSETDASQPPGLSLNFISPDNYITIDPALFDTVSSYTFVLKGTFDTGIVLYKHLTLKVSCSGSTALVHDPVPSSYI